MRTPIDADRRGARKRWATFAEAYIRHGNGTRAAIEAGYSPKSAHTKASELLRNPEVQERIQRRLIRKEVHAEQTYRNLIAIADGAMREAAIICGWQRGSVPDPDPMNRARAIEVARRANETLGRVEGMFVERVVARVDVQHTLQGLLERIRGAGSPTVSAPVATTPGRQAMAAIDAPPKIQHDGNGHAVESPPNGDGDSGGG